MTIIPTITHRPAQDRPILAARDRNTIVLTGGFSATIGDREFVFDDYEITLPDLIAGTDYALTIGEDGKPVVAAAADANPLDTGAFAGFHFAPGGNATERAGGDNIPAINPYSIWDTGFRPDATDPRGMFLAETAAGQRFWADIYLLGADHAKNGTSRFGVTIADGRHPAKLDYYDAVNALAEHGKRLLTYDQFRAAALGVTERSSAARHPKTTGLDAARTSRFGMMQATGNLWVWGTDGDQDDPRPSIFGGSWVHGSFAGSRYASLDYDPEDSGGDLGARGACDHLLPV